MEEFYVDKILTFGEQTKIYEYKVGNQHDANSNIIRFTNQDLFVPGFYYYVIIRSDYDEKVKHILIENNEFKIPSFMTRCPGKYLCQVAFTNKKIESGEQANKNNFIKISNKFYLKTVQSIFDEDDEVEGLDPNIKFLYDELLELKDSLIYKLENNLFDGLSAYEIAVNNGFVGDEDQWLDSLRYDHSEEFAQLALQVENNVKITTENALKAKVSENNSKLSETNAKTSENNSKLFSENSSKYCSDSKNYSDNAIQAADNANQSENNSKNSEIKAKEYHDNSSQILDDVRNIADEFINNSKEQTNLFNKNFDNKIISFNEQAAIKKEEFDDNYDLKVFIFDQDYNQKKSDLENKINDFNDDYQIKSTKINEISEAVKTNAKNALDSANLAQSSANTAQEAKEKALEHMSNAERFKNDASNYTNQANLAKTEAQKSATDASNSATSALDSSNKAKEHLDNVIEKTNVFNEDYTNKVNSFNSNAENANNTLDAKIEKANTDIDKKVLDANTNLDTKITDANASIDTKVTEATTQANIATDKATELKDAVDKVNYLEDVVDTKLTQPYVSNPIVENASISDSDEGQLRNLKVYGKCTQKVETDIVPTPDRPVPIVSKKIVVSGETVELRSLKESTNLFDIKLNGFNYGAVNASGVFNNSKTSVSTGFIKIKSNTTYAKSEHEGWNGVSKTFYDKGKNFISNSLALPFTTPNNATYFRLCLGKSSITQDEIDLLNNAFMVVEGTTVPTTYIPSTVRDYKIVDHVNKRSWIERNVGVYILNEETIIGKSPYNKDTDNNISWQLPVFKNGYRPNINQISNLLSYYNNAYKSGGDINGFKAEDKSCYILLSKKYGTTKEEILSILKDNLIILAKLITSTIEEIPYLESDTSEFGVSSQDTTSPSPNIKSPIETVDILNIKACAKNMFNPQGLNGGEIVKFNGVDCYKYVDNSSNFIFDFSHNMQARQFVFTTRIFREEGISNGTYMHFRYSDGTKATMNIQNVSQVYTFTSNPSKILKQIEGNYSYAKVCYIDLSVTQLEEGEVATAYEPYKETAITHTLANPLLSLADGSVKDVITLKNRLNLLSIYTFTGKETFSGSYGEQKGYYGRYFMLSKARGNINQKVFCNVLPYYGGSWSVGQESCCQNANQLHLKFSNIRLGIRDDTPIADKQLAFSNYIKEQYDNGTPIEFLYILENPTIEPLEPALVEKLKTLMSFYPITHIFSNAPLEFDYKLNLENWHKVVSGEVEDAKDIIYNMQVQQNNLEVMQLESALETQYNMDLLKLGGM